jgi:hypothetical protein
MHTAALARQALGLSLFEMSALLQVSKATLTQYEAGRRRRHGVSFGQNPQSKIISHQSSLINPRLQMLWVSAFTPAGCNVNSNTANRTLKPAIKNHQSAIADAVGFRLHPSGVQCE